MTDNWVKALQSYSWSTDLRDFSERNDYPGFFEREVTPEETTELEDKFREAVDEGSPLEVAGEVCFWKLYGHARIRNTRTSELLEHLEGGEWNRFRRAVRELSREPTYRNLETLGSRCGQPSGFAVPITFLSFYNPREYPMVDSRVGTWWNENKGEHGRGGVPEFNQRSDGYIPKSRRNWRAYLAWSEFSRDYAEILSSNTTMDWRPRDVEKAVFTAQDEGLTMESLSTDDY